MATIKDVAKRADVSIATVSRVLNGSSKVSDYTRETVLDAISELNFTPNASARGLQSKLTKTIGMIFPDASSYYFAEIIRGIQFRIRRAGYQMVIASSHDEEDEVRTLKNLLQSGRVDGMILMLPSVHTEEVLTRDIRDVPVVYINTEIETGGSITIVLDNMSGAKEATLHLIDHGHDRIGFIHGSPHNFDSLERYNGFMSAIREKNGGISILESHGNFTEASGFKAAIELLRRDDRPTAIFAANDAMAIGAIEAAKRLSLSVPDDVALIGFDDISTAQYISPSLTTLHVPVHEVGGIAGKSILGLLNGEKRSAQESRIVIPVELMKRESCGCTEEVTSGLIDS